MALCALHSLIRVYSLALSLSLSLSLYLPHRCLYYISFQLAKRTRKTSAHIRASLYYSLTDLSPSLYFSLFLSKSIYAEYIGNFLYSYKDGVIQHTVECQSIIQQKLVYVCMGIEIQVKKKERDPV